MNSPLHPDPALQYAALEKETPAASNYAPSVPISVYRELAAELKATKAQVDALNGQNQQLGQQNQLLRQEILRFAQSADQLRHAIESTQPAGFPLPTLERSEFRLEEAEAYSRFGGEPGSNLSTQVTRIVKTSAPQKRPQGSSKSQPLFTEQRSERPRHQSGSSRPKDMSGLWLATTILLIVVSAFGAGFLIMKPLLGGNR
ncbi:hypothetical protein [Pseudanabaena sp. FACHB-2040]|uniref:hypothetical protein n=1 Tax=Pseudanabaena sp. FACHB-2040 TaxID=2692859 RepID=UPI001683BB0A|nr:hypothetical protein [Pseudanabaena sp. FACHB-2040]MBD2260689.1 hypothetical protein [Pseudanabaena sp. FACHB-2040]